jgi:type II secretory pathway pseudopilin PulG
MNRLLLLSGALLLAACQVAPPVQQLQNEKQALQQNLQQAERQIDSLQKENRQLQANLTEARRVIGVLEKEKTERVTESTTLRGKVRHFVQREIDGFKAFLIDSNLLDYVGGELVRRAKYDQKPILLVDLANRVPRPGVLTGIGGYFAGPTTVQLKILRPVGDRLVVIWESRNIGIRQAGLVKQKLPHSVGVEKGDVLGYYFPRGNSAIFDTGTGDTRYQQDNLRPGTRLTPSSLGGSQEKRAYSLGVYGLLK